MLEGNVTYSATGLRLHMSAIIVLPLAGQFGLCIVWECGTVLDRNGGGTLSFVFWHFR
jgi:hypothetical protein